MILPKVTIIEVNKCYVVDDFKPNFDMNFFPDFTLLYILMRQIP